MIEIGSGIIIYDDELVYKVSRSGGPGGQNVNKLNTRITLLFDVAGSKSLSDIQKQRILARLANRIGKDGLLRVVSQRFRTQRANRRSAVKRLCELLGDALKTPRARKETTMPFAAKQRRLQKKRKRSLLKQQRAQESFEFEF